MEVGGQLHAPSALPPKKEPRCPLERRFYGPQSRSGLYGEKTNLVSLPGIEPWFLSHSALSLAATAAIINLNQMKRDKYTITQKRQRMFLLGEVLHTCPCNWSRARHISLFSSQICICISYVLTCLLRVTFRVESCGVQWKVKLSLSLIN
jgi:hypothetical protein